MGQRKLLLADDSITTQKVINLTFADEGVEVITAGDGDSALELLEEINPDVALLDVHMPGLNGYQLCEKIRQNELTKDLPVILLVGSFEPFDSAEAERVGANSHMTKPFRSIRDLVAGVNALIGAKETPESVPAPKQAITSETVESGVGDGAPEITDIENLYRDSFAEPPEVNYSEEQQGAFTYDAYDDEIIETSYTSPDAEEENDYVVAFPAEDRGGSNQFLRAESIADAIIEDNDDDSPEASYNSPFDAPANETHFDDEQFTEARSELESELEGEVDDDPSEPDEPERNIRELVSAETMSLDTIPLEISQPSYSFEDIDLLELPDAAGEKTFELTTPAAAVAAGSNKQVVTISPELLEVIVQKVVEKLAEKY